MIKKLTLSLILALGISGAQSITDNAEIKSKYDPNAMDLANRGNEYYRKGEYEKALLMYRKAERRGAPQEITSFNMGNSLYRLNKLPEAASSFKKSITLAPTAIPAAHFNYAAVLFQLKEYGSAVAAYRRALEIDPENLEGWIFLAEAYTRTSDYIGSERALEKAREMAPDDMNLVYQLAETKVSLNDLEAAIELLKSAQSKKPGDRELLVYLGDLYRNAGQLENSAAIFRECLTHHPDQADVMYKLADVLALDKKNFLAMDVLQKLTEVKPDNSDAFVFLGNLAYEAKMSDRARNAYSGALKLGNNEALQGLRNIAYDLDEAKKTEQALEVLKEAAQFSRDPALKKEIAEMESRLGKAPAP